MIALSNIAQGSSVLAMIVLQKKNEKAQQVSIPACISCYLGVTEPALFGVNLKYMFPFVCGMIGSAIAATFSVATGTMATSVGVGGIPGILSIIPKYMGNLAIAMIIAIVIPFVLTYIVGKKKLTDKDLGIETDIIDNEKFVSPMTGKLIKIEDVEDQVFATKAMGDGFAIELTDSDVLAPVSGEIVMTFPTKHAYGLRGNNGVEILIHLGMDTVQLEGKGFESFVKVGEYIKQGDKLAKVDIAYIKEHGKSIVSPVIFTSGEKISILKENCNIKKLETEIIKID